MSAPDFITRSRLIGKHHRLERSRCYHRFGRGRYYHRFEGIDITTGLDCIRYYHKFEGVDNTTGLKGVDGLCRQYRRWDGV